MKFGMYVQYVHTNVANILKEVQIPLLLVNVATFKKKSPNVQRAIDRSLSIQ